MKKGVWCRWQLLLGLVLALVCLSCRPSVAPGPRQAPPPPPAAHPEPPPQRPTFYVKVGRLNLRAGPGMDFPKLGLLERNEEVEKVGEAENWYQIRVKRDGTLGWVSSEYLSSNSERRTGCREKDREVTAIGVASRMCRFAVLEVPHGERSPLVERLVGLVDAVHEPHRLVRVS